MNRKITALSGKIKSRALAFERMEERLALSADFAINRDIQVFANGSTINSLILNQGGLVLTTDSTISFNFNSDKVQSIIDRVDGNRVEKFLEEHPAAASYYEELVKGAEESGPAATDFDQVTPIPQPDNQVEQPGGTIELSNIFLPSSLQSSPRSEYTQVESASEGSQLTAFDSSAKEPTLARARDVYFEVASLSTTLQPRGKHTALNVAAGQSPDDQAMLTDIANRLRPKAEPNEDAANKIPAAESQPANQTDKPGDVPEEAAQLMRSAERPAVPEAKSARDEKSLPADDELSTAEAHDQVLDELWGDELMAEEVAVSLRGNEGGKYYIALPTVAVLVGGGLIARHRRNSRTSEFQPPRKKLGSWLG